MIHIATFIKPINSFAVTALLYMLPQMAVAQSNGQCDGVHYRLREPIAITEASNGSLRSVAVFTYHARTLLSLRGVALANAETKRILTYKHTSKGLSPYSALSFSTGTLIPESVAAGDFLGTDNEELLVAGYNTENKRFEVRFYQLEGSYSKNSLHFKRRGVVANPSVDPKQIVTGDFDGDGQLDFALRGKQQLEIYKGDAQGSFTLKRSQQFKSDIFQSRSQEIVNLRVTKLDASSAEDLIVSLADGEDTSLRHIRQSVEALFNPLDLIAARDVSVTKDGSVISANRSLNGAGIAAFSQGYFLLWESTVNTLLPSQNGNGNNAGYEAQVSDSGGPCEIETAGSDSFRFESLRQTKLKAQPYDFDNTSVPGFAVYGSGIRYGTGTQSDYPEGAVYFCLQTTPEISRRVATLRILADPREVLIAQPYTGKLVGKAPANAYIIADDFSADKSTLLLAQGFAAEACQKKTSVTRGFAVIGNPFTREIGVDEIYMGKFDRMPSFEKASLYIFNKAKQVFDVVSYTTANGWHPANAKIQSGSGASLRITPSTLSATGSGFIGGLIDKGQISGGIRAVPSRRPAPFTWDFVASETIEDKLIGSDFPEWEFDFPFRNGDVAYTFSTASGFVGLVRENDQWISQGKKKPLHIPGLGGFLLFSTAVD